MPFRAAGHLIAVRDDDVRVETTPCARGGTVTVTMGDRKCVLEWELLSGDVMMWVYRSQETRWDDGRALDEKELAEVAAALRDGLAALGITSEWS